MIDDSIRKIIDEEMERAKRESEALFKKAERDGLALLDETKRKCDAMIDEAGRISLGITGRKSRTLSAVVFVFVTAAFWAGFFVGRVHI